MRLIWIKFTLLISLIFTINSQADIGYTSFISPLSLGVVETDSIFKNPAELVFHRNVVDCKLNYETKSNKFGGLFIFHIQDNFPLIMENSLNKLQLGDFAFSTEFFGTDFIWQLDRR